MLNYQTPDAFFGNCLYECRLIFNDPYTFTLAGVRQNSQLFSQLVRSLRDVRDGADAIYSKGKPSDEGLDYEEWSRLWSKWATARRAAFFSRAALYILNAENYFDYFLDTLRNSHNIVFLGASSDVLQHANAHYLDGPNEDLSRNALAEWWENWRSN